MTLRTLLVNGVLQRAWRAVGFAKEPRILAPNSSVAAGGGQSEPPIQKVGLESFLASYDLVVAHQPIRRREVI